MSGPRFYGVAPPGAWDEPLPGRLIVIEGTDGVGRSTQVSMLKEWLEDEGYAVVDTGLRRSQLAGPGIERAKRGHTLDPITLNLFYATDLWDQLERQILPALRAGMVALVDRYIFSIMARAVVRGVPRGWIEDLYGFALVPDRVIYLDIDVPGLLPRVLARGGFDYWESGLDYTGGNDVYGSFVTHQTRLLGEFRRLAEKHAFAVVDARGSVTEVFGGLRQEIAAVVSGMKAERAAPPGVTSPAP
ncbi:MAG: thymidylate kinase [Chloroflexi bacterium]|nr:thymidylate kinase [Chloroflexota bacterium]